MAKKGKSSYMKMQQAAQRSSNIKVKQEKQPQTQSNVRKQPVKQKSRKLALVANLSIYPEYRRDGGTTPPLEEGVGRFKYFWSVAKRRNSSILIANLMFVLFALPLAAVFAVTMAFGVEKLAYLLHSVQPPYLMTNVGFGISTSALSYAQVTSYMADVYYIIFGAAGVGVLIMSLGLSGMMPLCMNFILNDSFISKKDNYGNDVPRAIIEFFKGIKRYWWQFLIVGLFMMALVGGIGNVFVYFVTSFKLGTAGVGHWFMIIFAAAIALLGAMFIMHLMPIIVLYEMPFKDKMKNAAIFTLQMFVVNLFAVAVFSVPFILLGVTNMIVSSIVLAVLLVFGSKYYCLIMCNYEQNLSEKIIMPLYNDRISANKKRKNKINR